MKTKTHPTFDIEQKLWGKGFFHVIGVDEVGKGAFAGPVVAGAVIFSPTIQTTTNSSLLHLLKNINDSKLLLSGVREHLAVGIKQYAFAYAVSKVDVSVITKIGIKKATEVAWKKAVTRIKENLSSPNMFVLIDGQYTIPYLARTKQKAIIKGDQKSISIAAASIIAKVYRDNLMRTLSIKYCFYDFSDNKGYGTKNHQKALKLHGFSKIHRTSFNIKKYTSS